MARPSKRASANRKQRIVDAAAALFAKQGIQATTIEQIAGACDIRAPSVLYYFQNKENIFLEVIRQRVYQRFVDQFNLAAIDLRLPIDDVAEAALKIGVKVWRQEPKLIGATFAEFIRPGGFGQSATNAFLAPLIAGFERLATNQFGDGFKLPIPFRELALMFVLSLAGRFSTQEHEPNLWGPETEIFQAYHLILEAAKRQAKNNRGAPKNRP